ncbi:MAG: type II secretion system F family protein [Parasphingorhabdus sp.]|nr:type II secretion system F family protein [Parasphingorhabdus sp.]
MEIAIIAGGGLLVLLMIIFALAGPSLSRAQNKRIEQIKFRHTDNQSLRIESQMKKVMKQRRRPNGNDGNTPSRIDMLATRLDRTGKNWTLKQYTIASVGLGAVVAAALLLKGAPLALTAGLSLLMGAGLPHFVVGFLIKRRVNKFNASFPDAIELLVRGLRSGLPVTETIGVVATEVSGPVGEEFAMVVDRIKIGRTMEDSLQEGARRLDTPEFKFFCITLAIQRETGGNLAETLSNLADVLRKRAQMKLKIRAMSSESKASAYIVGSLPFVVFGLVWSVNPTYLAGFFYEDRLIIAGLGGLTWMSIGVFIMAKMVNFEI